MSEAAVDKLAVLHDGGVGVEVVDVVEAHHQVGVVVQVHVGGRCGVAEVVSTAQTVVCVCVQSQPLLVLQVGFGNDVGLSMAGINEGFVVGVGSRALSQLVLEGCISVVDLIFLVGCLVEHLIVLVKSVHVFSLSLLVSI